MAGSFTSGRYRFQVERSDGQGDRARGFDQELLDETFDLRLIRTGQIPELRCAPFASWLLARLARLTAGRLGLAGVEYVDGGDYVVEIVAYRLPADPPRGGATFVQPLLFDMEELGVQVEPERPAAAFQLQAGMEGAAVIGERAADCPAEEVLEALAAALLAAPAELLACEVAVYDPEWELDPAMYEPRPGPEVRNVYGWDGAQLLGEDNVREAE